MRISGFLILIFILNITGNASAQEIFFTSQVMQQDEFQVPSSPKKTFKIGEGIYAVAKMQTQIVNTKINGENPGNSVNLGYFVKINGEPVISNRAGRFAEAVPGAMFTRSVGGGEMYENDKLYFVVMADAKHPRLNVAEVNSPGKAFMKGVMKAGTGTHKVEVELRYSYNGAVSEPISKGNFTLVVDKLPTLDLDGEMPQAKMNNPALVKSMTAALANGNWKYKVLKINIVETDWEIHRNDFGRITHRSIDTYVAFKMDDEKCKAFNISFKQNFADSGYGTIQVNGTGDNYEISCEK